MSDREAKRRRPLLRWSLILLAALLVVALIVIVVVKVTGGEDGGKLTGPESDPFTLTYPAGWKKMSESELNKLANPTLAGVIRKDGRGRLLVSSKKPVRKDLEKLSSELKRELKKRVSGFKEVSAKVIRVRAGPALFYSYTAKGTNTTQSIVVVPAGSRSYQLNITAESGAADVGRQVKDMIFSFDL